MTQLVDVHLHSVPALRRYPPELKVQDGRSLEITELVLLLKRRAGGVCVLGRKNDVQHIIRVAGRVGERCAHLESVAGIS